MSIHTGVHSVELSISENREIKFSDDLSYQRRVVRNLSLYKCLNIPFPIHHFLTQKSSLSVRPAPISWFIAIFISTGISVTTHEHTNDTHTLSMDICPDYVLDYFVYASYVYWLIWVS